MVYKYTSSLNFNVLTTFTLQPSSVFHCLKKCSPHFALNWWVCIAKVGYKHCPPTTDLGIGLLGRMQIEGTKWNVEETKSSQGSTQEKRVLELPRNIHTAAHWELRTELEHCAQNLQFQCCVKFASGVVHLVLHLSFLLGEGDSICQLLGGWTTIMIWIHFFVLLSRIGGLQPPL